MEQMLQDIFEKVSGEYDAFREAELRKSPEEIMEDSETISLYKAAVSYFQYQTSDYENTDLEDYEIQKLHQIGEILPILTEMYWSYDVTPSLSYDSITEMLQTYVEEQYPEKKRRQNDELQR